MAEPTRCTQGLRRSRAPCRPTTETSLPLRPSPRQRHRDHDAEHHAPQDGRSLRSLCVKGRVIARCARSVVKGRRVASLTCQGTGESLRSVSRDGWALASLALCQGTGNRSLRSLRRQGTAASLRSASRDGWALASLALCQGTGDRSLRSLRRQGTRSSLRSPVNRRRAARPQKTWGHLREGRQPAIPRRGAAHALLITRQAHLGSLDGAQRTRPLIWSEATRRSLDAERSDSPSLDTERSDSPVP